MPYITATIIVQLLRVVIPHFETLYKEGQAGQSRLTQYTRYLTIALALLQSTTLVTVARSGQLFGTTGIPECEQLLTNDVWWAQLLMIITMTAGTGLIMWFAELVTERGIGNGMSLLIFTSIAAAFPASMWAIWQSRGFEVVPPRARGRHRRRRARGVRRAVAAPHPGAVRQAHGRSPHLRRHEHVHPDQGQHGRRRARHLRLVAAVHPGAHRAVQPAAGRARPPPAGWRGSRSTSPPATARCTWLVYFLLIVGFTYFYVAITFNPVEVADNMKKYGGFIPGIRAGRPTAEYLDYVLTRITLPGSLYLGFIALLPLIALAAVGANQNFPFGGASILIIVGVGLETVKQIDAQLQQRHYEGLLR